MKIVKIILFFNLFSCHNTNKIENTRLVYDNYVHYFGEIPFKIKAEYDFCYINRGGMSFSIKFVKMNCVFISIEKYTSSSLQKYTIFNK